MDGKKFQYVAGSFHYFRAFRDTWEDKLTVMKSTGLNVIDTYVEWATHEPEPNMYEWDDFADLPYFLELTQKLGLYVILRPGPYICAERDNVCLGIISSSRIINNFRYCFREAFRIGFSHNILVFGSELAIKTT